MLLRRSGGLCRPFFTANVQVQCTVYGCAYTHARTQGEVYLASVPACCLGLLPLLLLAWLLLAGAGAIQSFCLVLFV